MSRKRLSRPLYESLPWLYSTAGVVALIASYWTPYRPLSLLLGLLGLAVLLFGIVVWLRRRDYRAIRANYADPDSLSGDSDKFS
jgi:hypothetical protein